MTQKIFDKDRYNLGNREVFVETLKKQAILLNLGRLLQVLINIFAEKKHLEKLDKREGQEVQINFPAYDIQPNCLTFVLSKNPSDPFYKPSDNPKVTIIFNVNEEKLIPLLAKVVRTKYNIFGVLKLIFKYLLPGKVRYKPKWAIGTLIAVLRCFLIGKNELIKEIPLISEEI